MPRWDPTTLADAVNCRASVEWREGTRRISRHGDFDNLRPSPVLCAPLSGSFGGVRDIFASVSSRRRAGAKCIAVREDVYTLSRRDTTEERGRGL